MYQMLVDFKMVKPKTWYQKLGDRLYFFVDYHTVVPYLILTALGLAYLYYKNPTKFFGFYRNASSPVREMLVTITAFLNGLVKPLLNKPIKP